VRDIYRRLASGEGADELVFDSPASKSVNAWSPDGRVAVYDTGGLGATSDLFIVPLAGVRQPRILTVAPGFQHMAKVSPDGRLIAYVSTESGRYEVIVQTFPDQTGRWQITTDGGRDPVWRGDGREIFFTTEGAVMAVEVHMRSSSSLEWSTPRRLFTVNNLQQGPHRLTVSPDVERFIALTGVASAPQRLSTLLNWTPMVD
jgi:eukaryotic-like serine/threonine-protein kinase